ncbi:MAG: DUF2934 domain-containing protein [Phycisphaerales bacterium]|nr:DUF2934 domain-containing protein [Phycisphaerales bacterium]
MAKRQPRTTSGQTDSHQPRTAKTTAGSSTSQSAAKPTRRKRTTGRKANQAIESKTRINRDAISREAYLIWLERGGSAEDNWYEAERRLRALAGA